ncbi:HNH endonuclease signature motif containing protein [Pseudomonas sp. EpS/L25]|uniref:HNH endonuclease signature motif containing protein n=1 Tax=Pseudomonas sp. EpS/L25 TaxID=1749078 RepID=UPI0009E7964E|nr:HNH endonuclease signature motif containing protein [Pseudomonas sp. EpS/L25]
MKLSPLAQAAYDRAGERLRRRSTTPQRRPWTHAEEEMLRRRYPSEVARVLADELGRAVYRIHAKAKRLGLSKSEDFLESKECHRLDGSQGLSCRFAKGHQPWNKGLKGVATGGHATRFKPGHKPQNWLPIGSLRLSQEGYLQRKVTDTGYPPRDWIGVHILLWVEAYGPVPAGHCLSFRDGNKRHITLDNLELVSRAERMRRNTIHRYPPELKDAIRTLGRLKRAIQEAADEEQA